MKTSLSQLNFLFGVKLSLNEAQMSPVLLFKNAFVHHCNIHWRLSDQVSYKFSNQEKIKHYSLLALYADRVKDITKRIKRLLKTSLAQLKLWCIGALIGCLFMNDSRNLVTQTLKGNETVQVIEVH